MKRSFHHQSIFESRMAVIKFVASQSPKRVSSDQIAGVTSGSVRRHQRILSELVEAGYLVTDGCNPRGYWINKEKFKELTAL